jgi:hypothetical protein
MLSRISTRIIISFACGLFPLIGSANEIAGTAQVPTASISAVPPTQSSTEQVQLNTAISYDSLMIPSPMQFTIVLQNVVDSATAQEGDSVDGILRSDLILGNKLIAEAGSKVLGRVEKIRCSRRMTAAMLSNNERFKRHGALTVVFSEIHSRTNGITPIVGSISKQKSLLFIDSKHPRAIAAGKSGEVNVAEEALTKRAKVASIAISQGIPLGLGQLGVVGTGVTPVAMGVLGAANPAIVNGRPIDEDDKHPRINGFSHAFVSNLPGGIILNAFVFKGNKVKLKPGDELLVEAHSPYETNVIPLNKERSAP